MDVVSKDKEILHFQIQRLIVALFKNYLNLAEDIRDSHDQMLYKIEELLPESEKDKLNLVDYLDEAKYHYIRKRILDLGNDSIREIENILGKYEIKLSKKRPSESAVPER